MRIKFRMREEDMKAEKAVDERGGNRQRRIKGRHRRM